MNLPRRVDTRAFAGLSMAVEERVTFCNMLSSGKSSTSSALSTLDGMNESMEFMRCVVNMDFFDACKRSRASMNALSDASVRVKRIVQNRLRRSDLVPASCCMFLAMCTQQCKMFTCCPNT